MRKVKYSPEMKEQTVKYVLEGNKSATKVAKELGIDTNTVCRWVREYREAHQMPTYKGLIFHSDRGSQYSSKKYKVMLNENGITESMSAPGLGFPENEPVEFLGVHGMSLWQFLSRKLFRKSEKGVDIPEKIWYNRGGEDGHIQIYRTVLQQETSEGQSRVYESGRLPARAQRGLITASERYFAFFHSAPLHFKRQNTKRKVWSLFQPVNQASFTQVGNAYGCCVTHLQKSNQSKQVFGFYHLTHNVCWKLWN